MEPGKPIWNSTLLTNILPCSFPSFIYELLVTYWVSAKAVALGFNTVCQVIILLIVIPGYLLLEILWIFQLKSFGTTRDINSLSPDCYDSNSPNSHPASSKVSFSWYCTLSTSPPPKVQSSTWDVTFYGGYWQAKQFYMRKDWKNLCGTEEKASNWVCKIHLNLSLRALFNFS